MPLRDYQQAAFDAAKDYLTRSFSPCLIEAATGAGKSHIIAALAEWIAGFNAGRVLCIAPSKELVEQNYAKYLATGSPASIYSASAGKKCLRHDVIFATPVTVKNNIKRFPRCAAVVIDEAHGITPTIQAIVASLKSINPKLRVVGLTATPYRTGEGYIYEANGTEGAYFARLVYSIKAHELIERGFLTPPKEVRDLDANYDTLELEVNKMGRFDAEQVKQVFDNNSRLTAHIVRDIMLRSAERRGVVIFAATIKHAEEVMSSLHPMDSRLITGKTKKADREKALEDFKAQRFKYLVNVAVLTTGFDAPHIDVIALMRATESPGLLQQMIGRGLRLYEGKEDCLILDYAENIERHCPDWDIFNPDIKEPGEKKDYEPLPVRCPACGHVNEFAPVDNPAGHRITEDGYFEDLMGNPIVVEFGNKTLRVPAHKGRRCNGRTLENMQEVRCTHRWAIKECPECGHPNDIAARGCEACGNELIDPNEKLRLQISRIKADPYTLTSEAVQDCYFFHHVSAAGNECVRVEVVQENGLKVTGYFMPQVRQTWVSLNEAVYGTGRIAPDVDAFLKYLKTHGRQPVTVSAVKDRNSGYYKIKAFNEPETCIENL